MQMRSSLKNTGGFTRASSAVDESGSVEFSLVDDKGAAAEGVEVLLTNAATAEVLTAVAANGSVVFEGVAPGVWTVASTAQGITFTNVAIASSAAAAAGAAGIGTAAAVGLGGTAVAGTAIAVNEANDSSSSSMSPSS